MRIRLLMRKEVPTLLALYQAAFMGKPWFMSWSLEKTKNLFQERSALPDFLCHVLIKDGVIVAAHGYNRFSDWKQLGEYLGPTVGEDLAVQLAGSEIYYENLLITDTKVQGRGLATRLRQEVFRRLRRKINSQKAVVIARYRSDNFGTIQSAKKCGFVHSGIESPLPNGLFFQYWQLIL